MGAGNGMRIFRRILLPVAAALAIIFAAAGTYLLGTERMTAIAGFASAGQGETLLARVDGGRFTIDRLDGRGVVRERMRLARRQGGMQVSIADLAVDEDGVLYLLLDYSDPYTGVFQHQELTAWDPGKLWRKRLAAHPLEDGVRYRWLSVGSSVILMGADADGAVLTRTAYETAAVREGADLIAKSARTYPLAPAEGIYRALPQGLRVAYTTMSGKVFVTEEGGQAREIYPARELTEVMYPAFLCPESAETVVIGEQESGDLCSLNTVTGETRVLKNGTEPFSGVSSYAPADLAAMSMWDGQNFTGAARNEGARAYDLVVSDETGVRVISELTLGFGLTARRAAALALLGFGALVAAMGAVWGVAWMIRHSHTLLVKLAFSTLPILVLALLLFGGVTYRSYSASVEQSFQKQVVDEGNLLTALFGAESFDEIEYPYDYTGEAYGYLAQQMGTRAGYTRTAYYERDQLFTGVDPRLPCFYPFSITLNDGAEELHRRAAFTGEAVTGIVDDGSGRRITCVTPIGGVSGNTVYLVETGIYTANMDRYTGAYIRNYCLVSLGFILVVGLLLLMLFMRILRPLGQIKEGLEEFARGNRDVRLQSATEDELADISRVFNKMANDIDAQIYDLKTISDNYYRFIPPRLFQLLGRRNLGELNLESHVEGSYYLLSARLHLSAGKQGLDDCRELANRFFSIVDEAADERGATVLADGADLRRLQVLCPEDANACVEIALAALAKIDGANAALPVQKRMEVTFMVHRAPACYGVCGDERRYVPAVISDELEWLESQEPLLRQLAVRLIVTEAAYGGVDAGRFFHRRIGSFGEQGGRELAMYDFYDGNSPETTRLLNATRGTFDKAMELFAEKRYYDAKNLFAVVLRENQYDNVARYYIFRCEKLL